MTMIQLITPNTAYISQLIAYKEEFLDAPHTMDGSSMLAFANSVEEWLVEMENNQHGETVREGWLPSIQYVAIDTTDHSIVGMLNFRKQLNEHFINYYGHIGYSVAPSKRRQGIATKMLQLTLVEAKKAGLEKFLITCADENLASAGVIEKNGGVLEDKRLDPGDGKLTRRYWIEL